MHSNETWLAEARANADKLRSLIHSFHPAYARYGRPDMPITAPNAEAACRRVRTAIEADTVEDPVVVFDAALADGNIFAVYNVLSATWFGVPESTDCWRLEGFAEAVGLMDDMPDPPEREEEEPDGREGDR